MSSQAAAFERRANGSKTRLYFNDLGAVGGSSLSNCSVTTTCGTRSARIRTWSNHAPSSSGHECSNSATGILRPAAQLSRRRRPQWRANFRSRQSKQHNRLSFGRDGSNFTTCNDLFQDRGSVPRPSDRKSTLRPRLLPAGMRDSRESFRSCTYPGPHI